MKVFAFIDTRINEMVSVTEVSDEIVPPTPPDFLIKEITLAEADTFKQERLGDDSKAYQYVPATDSLIMADREQVPAILSADTVIANGVDTITISNLPNPTTVSIEDVGDYTVEDGVFEATFDSAGEYSITCRSENYLNKEFIINAS